MERSDNRAGPHIGRPIVDRKEQKSSWTGGWTRVHYRETRRCGWRNEVMNPVAAGWKWSDWYGTSRGSNRPWRRGIVRDVSLYRYGARSSGGELGIVGVSDIEVEAGSGCGGRERGDLWSGRRWSGHCAKNGTQNRNVLLLSL